MASKFSVGDKVSVQTKDSTYDGIVMPSPAGEADVLTLKLASGYNLGIRLTKDVSIKKLGTVEKVSIPEFKAPAKKGLPNITILHTGGTIASQVDYRTGAVVARFTPDQLLKLVPEMANIANIKAHLVFQMFSEDMEPEHWSILADKVAEVAKKDNPKGIIIGFGTDTLEYASSALSFALQNIPVPVLLVGAQRSSDRPSTDAATNLICAAQFIAKTDFAGVAACVHKNSSDDWCLIIEGNHLKKMHTSRRDTFRPINKIPVAKVNSAGVVEYFSKDYPKAAGKFEVKSKFSSKVGLVKMHPGFRAAELDYYEKNCDGIVIEGYAFGQMPVNKLDKFTEHHPELLEKLRQMAKKILVVVTSQRPYGLPNMQVYSTSRDILAAGAIEGRMQTHVAFAKLCWVLAQTKNLEERKKLMQENIAGEILEKISPETYLY